MHWIHSRIKFLNEILRIQQIALKEENEERTLLEVQLENMKKPFGYIEAYYKQEAILEVGLDKDPEKRFE